MLFLPFTVITVDRHILFAIGQLSVAFGFRLLSLSRVAGAGPPVAGRPESRSKWAYSLPGC